ncbi:MAG: hypothetical protein M3O15_07945 [Acidobacteriota bacterium]|nr:hypothetical protein [Acidobacteriota bacterium]
MKKSQPKRLKLHRETLATIGTMTTLDQVAGGGTIARTAACPSLFTCFVTCDTNTLNINVCVPNSVHCAFGPV